MEVADPRVIGDPRGVPIKDVAQIAGRADADAAVLGAAVRHPDAEPWARSAPQVPARTRSMPCG